MTSKKKSTAKKSASRGGKSPVKKKAASKKKVSTRKKTAPKKKAAAKNNARPAAKKVATKKKAAPTKKAAAKKSTVAKKKSTPTRSQSAPKKGIPSENKQEVKKIIPSTSDPVTQKENEEVSEVQKETIRKNIADRIELPGVIEESTISTNETKEVPEPETEQGVKGIFNKSNRLAPARNHDPHHIQLNKVKKGGPKPTGKKPLW